MEESRSCRTILNPSMILAVAGILLISIPLAMAQEWTRQAPASPPKGPGRTRVCHRTNAPTC